MKPRADDIARAFLGPPITRKEMRIEDALLDAVRITIAAFRSPKASASGFHLADDEEATAE
jgi:hypothetical protein